MHDPGTEDALLFMDRIVMDPFEGRGAGQHAGP
jgi:hypothetical protein